MFNTISNIIVVVILSGLSQNSYSCSIICPNYWTVIDSTEPGIYVKNTYEGLQLASTVVFSGNLDTIDNEIVTSTLISSRTYSVTMVDSIFQNKSEKYDYVYWGHLVSRNNYKIYTTDCSEEIPVLKIDSTITDSIIQISDPNNNIVNGGEIKLIKICLENATTYYDSVVYVVDGVLKGNIFKDTLYFEISYTIIYNTFDIYSSTKYYDVPNNTLIFTNDLSEYQGRLRTISSCTCNSTGYRYYSPSGFYVKDNNEIMHSNYEGVSLPLNPILPNYTDIMVNDNPSPVLEFHLSNSLFDGRQFTFDIQKAQNITITLLSISGEKYILAKQLFNPGHYSFSVPKRIKPGIYFLKTEGKRINEVRKMVLVR